MLDGAGEMGANLAVVDLGAGGRGILDDVVQQRGTLLPGEGVAWRTRRVGRAEHDNHLACCGERVAQQGQVPVVEGLETPDENGGVVHASKK